jgi:two-component system, chemotaxis family, sensor kinase CheA
LTHLVRNSVDHGIESPEARARAGKDATGRVMLRASHEGGQVHIEICDDGAGLDSERIRQKAVGKGLVSAEQAIRMTDRDIVNLIFMPGFSTAEKVSRVSGRGVGMDVVRTNIEKIGGTVDVQSSPGLGTTVHMRIPLTLAIIPALIVTGGSARYAIPQVCLLELVHLEAEQAASRIERVHGALVHRLRGRLLPLVFLEQALGAEQSRAADRKGAVNIVVLQANDQQFGLVVDEIKDTEEIVVKPLGRQLKGVSAFAGATIMGDGKVALILDPVGLAQRARVIGGAAPRIVKEQERTAEEKAGGSRQTLLLFQIGQSGRMAVPLSLVARLEDFPRSAVERSGSQQVVQYRGRIMPLVNISAAVEVSGLAEEGAGSPAHSPLQVLVHSESGRSVGLVVDRILDIVEEEILVEKVGQRRGVLGSAVVQKRVTDLLDIHELLRLTQPGFARAAAAGD